MAVSTWGISLYPTNEVAMFFNQPGGQFTLSYFVSGRGGYDMRVGDLNEDGKLDLVVEPYPPLNPPTIAEVVFHHHLRGARHAKVGSFAPIFFRAQMIVSADDLSTARQSTSGSNF
jgi:hypothetical protein